MGLIGTIGVKLTALTTEFKRDLKKAELSLEDFEGKVDQVGVAATAAFVGLGVGIATVISKASDASEQLNVITQSFGEELTPATLAWADATADAVGRSTFQMRDFAGQIQSLISPMLDNKEAAAGLSKGVAKLAVDMGSFFNVADDEALIALRAGLIGSSEPLQRFGVDVREGALQAFALSKGLDINTAKLDAGQKALLRYAVIMDQTSTVQGDATRTIDGLANATKAIAGKVEELAVKVGSVFLPEAEAMLMTIKGWLVTLKQLPAPFIKLVADLALTAFQFAGVVAGVLALTKGVILMKAAFVALVPFVKATFVALLPLAAVAAGIAGAAAGIGAIKGLFSDDAAARITKGQGTGGGIAASIKEGLFIPEITKALGLDKLGEETEKTGKQIDVAGDTTSDALKKLTESLKVNNAAVKTSTDKINEFDFGSVVDAAAQGIGDALGDVTSVLQDRLSGAGGQLAANRSQGGFAGEALSAGSEFQAVAENVAGAAVEASKAGDVIKGALAGAAQGGIIGAIIGAIVALVTKLEIFNSVVGLLDGILDNVVGAIDQILSPFAVFFEIIGELIGTLFEVLNFGQITKILTAILKPVVKIVGLLGGVLQTFFRGIEPLLLIVGNLVTLIVEVLNLFSGLNTVLELLNKVLEFVANVMRNIAGLLARGFNAIIGFFAGVFNKLKNVPLIGDTFKALARKLNDAKISMSDFSSGLTGAGAGGGVDPIPVINGITEMGNAAQDTANTLQTLNQSLTNVPTGFKAELARFDSTDSESLGADSGGAVGISTLVLAALDPDELVSRMESILETQGFINNGSPVGGRKPFGVESGGG